MRLLVTRHTFTTLSTIGNLAVDGAQFCFTLEPPKRAEKPCCIGLGTFDVEILWSEEHHRLLPHVMNVPGFTAIEIHPGNFPKDTKACLCVGGTVGPNPDFIGTSDVTFNKLFLLMTEAKERGEKITITYAEAEPAPLQSAA